MLGSWWFTFKNLQAAPKAAPGKPKIAASIYPLYDMVRTIAGENETIALLQPPGSETQPQITDIELVFMVGHGVDDWVTTHTAANISLVTVDKEVQLLPLETYNAYWLSLNNAKKIVQTITSTLSAREPSKTAEYQARSAQLLQKIDDLYQYGRVIKNQQPNRTINLASPEGQYLTNEFSLQEITDVTKKPITLDTIGGSIDKDTYPSLMKSNIDTIFIDNTP